EDLNLSSRGGDHSNYLVSDLLFSLLPGLFRSQHRPERDTPSIEELLKFHKEAAMERRLERRLRMRFALKWTADWFWRSTTAVLLGHLAFSTAVDPWAVVRTTEQGVRVAEVVSELEY